MFLFNHKFDFLYDNEGGGGTIEDGKMSISDMTEFLGKEDEPLELEENTENDEEEPEEKDEEEKKKPSIEDELEEELKDRSDEEDEVPMPVGRKEVLAKYPNLFKEFPHLDKAVYREQKYSEMLPTLRDAKIAVEKAENLDRISEELEQGNTTTLLKALKEEDSEAFNTLADNYLEQLHSVDQNAYFTILGNVIKRTVLAMHSSQDDDTKTAAAILYKFIFNTDKYEPPVRLGKDRSQKDDREIQIEQREQEFRKNQLETHMNTVNTRIDNSIRASIDKYLDPKNSMNDWQREQAVNACINSLQNNINKDTRFQKLLDKLWEKAGENNFSQDSLDKIRSAYLSKAKGLLSEVIRVTRNKALKGLGNRSPESERKGPLPVGRPANERKNNNQPNVSRNGSDKDKARALPKGTKSIDYLMRD